MTGEGTEAALVTEQPVSAPVVDAQADVSGLAQILAAVSDCNNTSAHPSHSTSTEPEASTPAIGEQPTEREATTRRIGEQPTLELQQAISATQNSIGPEEPSLAAFEHPTVTLPAAVVARPEVSRPVVQVTTPLPELSTAARPGLRQAAEAAPDQCGTGTSVLRRVRFIPVSSNLAAIHQRAFRDLQLLKGRSSQQPTALLSSTPHSDTFAEDIQTEPGRAVTMLQNVAPTVRQCSTEAYDASADERDSQSSMSDLDLDGNTGLVRVPPVEEEEDEESAPGRRGSGPKPLPWVDPLIVEYVARRFPGRIARAQYLSRTPPPYGVAYRDVLRLRTIGGALADLGIGTGKGLRDSVIVNVHGIEVVIRPADVMVTLGMRPSTYRSVRSRLEKVQSVYTWLAQNKPMWEGRLGRNGEVPFEKRAYPAMVALFGPEELPNRRIIPAEPLPSGVHDALWEPCSTFVNWANVAIQRYGLVRRLTLPASPDFYDVAE
ncbi:hypothetical protein K466DRAFT_601969 [Polyporus arcularius HHB13444]|uniref:Uncharacterized protein n=1 Tax=Polyporus arcularius HHB13444 TaxID=1314778 RepID=A0A5C3P495_9APHY|nr:hypothetical protein K466DRAFT_601969 [Polyporus arcularius HHB13444]